MGNETSKLRALWSNFERSIFTGKGIDIGCGGDPVCEDVLQFDQGQGDANRITEYVADRDFDYVYSSHCLEHMHDPVGALAGWWQLVKPGGFLFLIVPDEDLYEQGVWPSRFAPDHKWTFTLSKRNSWSPVSINLIELVFGNLPGSDVVMIELQDAGYDRSIIGVDQTQGPALAQIQCIVRKRD